MTPSQKSNAWQWAANLLDQRVRQAVLITPDEAERYILQTVIPAMRKRASNIERRKK